jgi:cytochrome P450
MTITEGALQRQSFHDAAPMSADRSAAWRYFREPGDVYERDGVWYLTSHEAVRYAHQHPEIFSSARAYDELGSPVPLIPIAIDQPEHVRYRRLLDPMFAPRVINDIEPELRRQAREVIAAFEHRGQCDAIADLGELYPTQVILTLFGLPLADRDQFIHWSKVIVEVSGAAGEVTPERAESAMALFVYLQDYITKKRADPGADSLSTILSLSGDDAWRDDEVLGLCFLFVLAGLDTVTAMIGFVLAHLATHAELRRQIVADPSLIGPAIEEILRLDLPAPFTPRITQSDVAVCGVTIPANSRVHLVLGTANRDGRPDEVDLETADQGHLAFGGGIHRCLGSHLARRELRLVVEEFLRVIPEFELAAGAEPHVVWPSGTLHLASVPLTFPAVAGGAQ